MQSVSGAAPAAQPAQGEAPKPIPALIGELPGGDSSAVKRGEFEVVATTFNPSGDVPEGIPEYAVTYDPNFVLLLRVDEVLPGDSPFVPGQEIVLLVHSPALMFGGYDFSGRQFAYRFAVLQQQDGTTSYSLIGLDTWPRSRPQNRDER